MSYVPDFDQRRDVAWQVLRRVRGKATREHLLASTFGLHTTPMVPVGIVRAHMEQELAAEAQAAEHELIGRRYTGARMAVGGNMSSSTRRNMALATVGALSLHAASYQPASTALTTGIRPDMSPAVQQYVDLPRTAFANRIKLVYDDGATEHIKRNLPEFLDRYGNMVAVSDADTILYVVRNFGSREYMVEAQARFQAYAMVNHRKRIVFVALEQAGAHMPVPAMQSRSVVLHHVAGDFSVDDPTNAFALAQLSSP